MFRFPHRECDNSHKGLVGATEGSDWLGPLCLTANYIAHLFFLSECMHESMWLVNLYFTNDPIQPTSLEEWRHELAGVKRTLGLREQIPNTLEVFLPALAER